MSNTDQLEEFLAPYPDHVVETMLKSREILLNLLSPVSELWFDATTAVCDGFAFVPTVKGVFVNTAAFSDHVTLIFGHGASLADPEGTLKGEGKQVRHIRLKEAQDLEDPYVVNLIRQAESNAPRPEGEFVPELVVKIYEGPKRRPKS